MSPLGQSAKKKFSDFDLNVHAWTPEDCQDFVHLLMQAGQLSDGGYRVRMGAQFIRNKGSRVAYAHMAQKLLQSMVR